jgi:uncharacterized protein YbjT (DUF2867 family)
MKHNVFITGGSGYVGSAVIPQLINRGHAVRTLVRSESLSKLSSNCEVIFGNVLDNKTYKDKIFPSDIVLHLVGVSHPNPFKKDLFNKIDLKSVEQTIEAAISSGTQHFIYLSVAHPAPIMKSYIEIRKKCEVIICESGLSATIIRPWYVLGPGHFWPYLLIPFYKIFRHIASTKETANRLGLVTLTQLTKSIIHAIESPPINSVRLIEVPEIQKRYH